MTPADLKTVEAVGRTLEVHDATPPASRCECAICAYDTESLVQQTRTLLRLVRAQPCGLCETCKHNGQNKWHDSGAWCIRHGAYCQNFGNTCGAWGARDAD